jgi:hypothetical protein
MSLTDRLSRLIGDIEIPGVDANEDDDEPLPGVVPVIADDIKIPGVDVEVPKAQDAVPAPHVEIDDLDIPHEDPDPIEVAVNPSGKTGTQIPQLPLGDNSSPWGDNAVCT